MELPEGLAQTLPRPLKSVSEIRPRYSIETDPAVEEAIAMVDRAENHHPLPYEMEHPAAGCHVVPLLDPSCMYSGDSGMREVSLLRGFDVTFKLLECFPQGKNAPVVEILLLSPGDGYLTLECAGRRYADISSQMNSLKREEQYAQTFVIRVVRKRGAPPEYYHYNGCSGNVVIAWALAIEGFTVGSTIIDGNVVVIKLDHHTVYATIDPRRVHPSTSTASALADSITVTRSPRSSIDGMPPPAERKNSYSHVHVQEKESDIVPGTSLVDISVCSPLLAGWYTSCSATFTLVKPLERAAGVGSFFRSFFS